MTALNRFLAGMLRVFPDYKDASANAKNAVIPAWMPESRARGWLSMAPVSDLGIMPSHTFTSM